MSLAPSFFNIPSIFLHCAISIYSPLKRYLRRISQQEGTSRQISGKGAISKRFPLQKPEVGKHQTNNQVPIP